MLSIIAPGKEDDPTSPTNLSPILVTEMGLTLDNSSLYFFIKSLNLKRTDGGIVGLIVLSGSQLTIRLVVLSRNPVIAYPSKSNSGRNKFSLLINALSFGNSTIF